MHGFLKVCQLKIEQQLKQCSKLGMFKCKLDAKFNNNVFWFKKQIIIREFNRENIRLFTGI